MLLTDFRELARNNHACKKGMNYLSQWMDAHPRTKTTTQFFKAHYKIKRDNCCYSSHGYMRWIFRYLIDWTKVIGVEVLFENQKAEEYLNGYMVCGAPIKVLINALIYNFED
jgi:hypothetical protein